MKAIELEKSYNPKDFEDRIYEQWVEKGNIIERGNHDDLMAKKGRYYALYTGGIELD